MHVVRVTDEEKQKSEDRARKSQQAFAEMLNKPAPDFDLKDMQGRRWSLSALRGKIIILNFWFTSCPPCIGEMPALNQLVRSYDHKDVVFLGLTFNNADQIQKFLEGHSFDYTLIPDADEVAGNTRSILANQHGNRSQRNIKTILSSRPNIGQELSEAIDSLP